MLRFLTTLFNYSAYFDNFAPVEFGIIMILVGFYMYYEIFVARPVQFHFKAVLIDVSDDTWKEIIII